MGCSNDVNTEDDKEPNKKNKDYESSSDEDFEDWEEYNSKYLLKLNYIN